MEVAPAQLPCEIEGWPCHPNDIEPDALAAQIEIDAYILERTTQGASIEDIAATLRQRDDVVFVEIAPTFLLYRVEGAPPRPFLLVPFRDASAPSIGGLGAPHVPRTSTSRRSLVAYQNTYERHALFSDPIAYEGASPAVSNVNEILLQTPGYDSGRRVYEALRTEPGPDTTDNTWLFPFLNWRTFQFVSVHSHGIDFTFPSGRYATFFALITSFDSEAACGEWLSSQSVPGIQCITGTRDDPPRTVTYIALSLDTLTSLNSAPLETTTAYMGACFIGDEAAFDASAPGSRFISKDAVMVGWDEKTYEADSNQVNVEFAHALVGLGLRAGDARERVSTTASAEANLTLVGGTDSRAREVVFFVGESGDVLRPLDTGLLELDYQDGLGWSAPLLVRIDGVLDDEIERFQTTLSIDTSDGITGRFEPDMVFPRSRGVKPGPIEHSYLIPTRVIFGEDAPSNGQMLSLRATTELPEGGTSSGLSPRIGALSASNSKGYASFVAVRSSCAFGHLDIAGGPGSGARNVNTVQTFSPLDGLFMLSFTSSTRFNLDQADEYVDQFAPVGTISVQGELPQTGETKTYSGEQLNVVVTVLDSDPYSSYLVDASDGEGDATLTLTRRDDGMYSGRLTGTATYPNDNERLGASIRLELLAGPIDEEGEEFQCF